MRSTEGRQEIVQRYFISEVVDRYGCGDARPAFPMQEIVRTDPEIEHASWFNTVGVMVEFS
jgi:hypothetical protein